MKNFIFKRKGRIGREGGKAGRSSVPHSTEAGKRKIEKRPMAIGIMKSLVWESNFKEKWG